MQKIIALICLGIVCLGLAGCGKRGDLLPPPGYEKPAEEARP
ncbi:LPS translocon maturation chaperone LptM [Paremcibacter congregatus]